MENLRKKSEIINHFSPTEKYMIFFTRREWHESSFYFENYCLYAKYRKINKITSFQFNKINDRKTFI